MVAYDCSGRGGAAIRSKRRGWGAAHHAHAGRVEVSIAETGGRRVVAVRDDGAGFDGGTSGSGQGLENIKLRAEAIHGQLSLRSEPGRGTSIEVLLRPA